MYLLVSLVLVAMYYLREEYKERKAMQQKVEAFRQEVEEFLNKK